MNCPHCDTNDIARCCVIYAQGTVAGSSRATAVGGYVPGIGFDQATVYGSNSSSSALAQVVAPPERPVWRGNGCLIVIITVVLSFPTFYLIREIEKWFGLPPGDWEALMFVPGLLTTPLFVASHILARANDGREIEQWGMTWICLRCGHKWIPEGK